MRSQTLNLTHATKIICKYRYTFMWKYIYIYILRKREREREWGRERKEQLYKYMCLYGCVYMEVHAGIRTHTHTRARANTHAHTHRLHICMCIHKKNRKGQRSLQTINSRRIFEDRNPWIKKNHTYIKTIFTIKAKT